MKLEYDYQPEADDLKHGVKDADTGLYVASIYISGMSFGGTKTQDDKAAENLAKVFAASLDMLEDLKMAVVRENSRSATARRTRRSIPTERRHPADGTCNSSILR